MAEVRRGNLYVQLDDRGFSAAARKKCADRLGKRYPLLADQIGDRDGTDYLLDLMFGEGLPATFYVANLSVNRRPTDLILAVRMPPQQDALWPLPEGVSLVAKGFWELRSGSPVLKIQDFVEGPVGPSRSFEAEVDVLTYQWDRQPDGARRSNNVLTRELAESLPPISEITQTKLELWLDFLSWKESLVRREMRGARYLSRQWSEDGTSLQFLAVAESQEELRRSLRTLERTEAIAFPLSTSVDRWTFKVGERREGRDRGPKGVSIGDVSGRFLARTPSATLSGCTWAAPIEALINAQPTEDDQNYLDQADDPFAARQQVLDRIPEQGFLGVSAAGDLSLIDRQRRAAERLRDQGGFAPYLSAYIFDATMARSPEQVIPVTEWSRPDLNEAQQDAVAKILSAPDLCLIQGPPGTGKTTVIAEAIVQLARRGETVLLASQAHTAVDNALARLAEDQSLRVVRLSRNENRVTEEGQQFLNDSALDRYYRTLSMGAHGVLQRWTGDETLLDNATAWLAQAETAGRTLKQAEADLDAHDEALAQLESDFQSILTGLRDKEAKNEAATYRASQLSLLYEAISENRWDVAIDPAIRLPRLQATELAQSVMSLAEAHVALGHLPDEWKLSKGAPVPLMKLMEIRTRLAHLMPVLAQDAKRLHEAREGRIGDPAVAERLSQLEQELSELQTAMVEDVSLAPRWQALKREEIELRKRNSDLDPDVYAIFDDARDFLKRAQSGVFKKKVSTEGLKKMGDELYRRLSIIDAAQTRIDDQVKVLLEALERESDLGSLTEIDYAPLDAARSAVEVHAGKRNLVEQRQQSASLAVATTFRAGVEILRQLGGPPPSARASLKTLVSGVRKALEDQELRVRRNEEDRLVWEPVLMDWIADLGEPNVAKKDWEDFESRWVPECNVVAITCNENDFTLQDAGLYSFDVAIIDEVSKATPLEMLLPLMRARRSVLVGDHRQLPPVFRESQDAQAFTDVIEEDEESPTALTKDNLRRYEKLVTASLFKSHFETADESIKSLLDVQYRMHPQIMNLVNCFYENQLQCGIPDPDAERAHGLTMLDKNHRAFITPIDHAVWIDTSLDLEGKPSSEDQTDGRPRRSNRLEAQLIAHTLMDLNEQCRLLGHGSSLPKKPVGVVSFYANQCKAIREEIRKIQPGGKFECLDIEINTAIRYQGKEKEVVLVSLVRNYGYGIDGKRHRKPSSKANVARYEFINVAFSRAQQLLIIFGARSSFQDIEINLPNMNQPGVRSRAVYGEIISELDRQARLIEARLLMAAPTQQKRRSSGNRAQAHRGGKP